MINISCIYIVFVCDAALARLESSTERFAVIMTSTRDIMTSDTNMTEERDQKKL